MKITLYKYNDEAEKIHKTLDESSALQLPETSFNREYPIISPIIRLTSDNDLSEYNYAVVDGKKYFVDNVMKYRKNFFELHMTLDVITTYSELILNQTGTVTQSKTALYLQGTHIPVYSETKIKKYEFPNHPFNKDGCYILIGLGYVPETN